MLQLPGENIALAFSDPAGANACISFSKILRAKGRKATLFSNRNYFEDSKDGFYILDSGLKFPAKEFDCLFTGTSHPDSSDYFELECINVARALDIRTISFVDHWVNFRLRFTDRSGQLTLPDEIWVIDKEAMKIAVSEGLPEERLKISKNPHHEFLRDYWKSSYHGKSYLNTLGIATKGKHIVYVPDPLSVRNGQETAGFTEIEALQDLIISIKNMDITLVVKCHPLQPKQSFDDIPDSKNINFTWVGDPLEIVNAADLVVGIYSNLLIEAELIGKKVVRYFPGNESADLLRHIDFIPCVKNINELGKFIKNHFHG